MGGLGRELPWTTRFFLIGALALAAIPPFAGFFSKDAILASAANAGTLGWILWGAGGGRRLPDGALHVPPRLHRLRRPDRPSMRGATCTGGRFEGPFDDDVARRAPGRSLGGRRLPAGAGRSGHADRPLARARGGVDRGGVGRDRGSVRRRRARPLGCGDRRSPGGCTGGRAAVPRRLRERMPWATRALEHKLYFDEAYDVVFYEPASRTASGLLRFVERPIFLASLGGIGIDRARDLAKSRRRRADGRRPPLRRSPSRSGSPSMTVVFLIAT